MYRKLKPVTPSSRHTLVSIKNLAKKPLLKKSTKTYKQSIGKNNQGKITVRHKQKGAKKKYRFIDFKRSDELNGVVCSVEHDPYRSAFIASVFNLETKEFFYTLAAEGIVPGDYIRTGKLSRHIPGHSRPLFMVPAGAAVFNLTVRKNYTGQVARSAGTYCVVRGYRGPYTYVELPSGEVRLVPSCNHVVIGRASNTMHFLERRGKAGRSRWMGERPATRGVAMNPVDHPNGGGEGKKSGPGRDPWGKPSKRGKLTRVRRRNIVKKRYE